MLRLPSPAKVNHFLHIVGRRSDGYHLLQTLFQFLDYGDTLSFELRQDNQIVLTPQIPGIPQEQNLIYRALMALRSKSKQEQGVTIHIEKKLPLGGGLGGGSSNAATTLFALNELWQLNLSTQELMNIGLTLGADVPIFLYGHCAWAEGIGEQLTAVKFNEYWMLVIVPNCHVSTPAMFANPDLTRSTPRLTIEALAKSEESLRNDFEPLVRKFYPEVDGAMKWLSNYGKPKLSGSGASVFACFDSQAQAQEVAKNLPRRFKFFIAKGANESPLIVAAKDWGVAKR